MNNDKTLDTSSNKTSYQTNNDDITSSSHDDETGLQNTLNDNCIFHQVKQFYLTNKHNLKISHINVNSLRHKFEPFKEIMSHSIFDILCLQETKIDCSFPESQFKVPKYKMYRKDYKENEGGLIMYVRNDMPQSRCNRIEEFAENNEHGRIELLAVEITIKGEKWIMVSVYKQPKVHNNTMTQCIDRIMNVCLNSYHNIVLLGDFNVNMANPNVMKANFDTNGLTNIIKDPTCFKGTPSIIDLFVTNQPKRFCHSISVDVGISDFHNMICIASRFHVPKHKSTTIYYRSFRHFDETTFLTDLSSVPYHIVEVFDDIDDSYWAWHTLTMEIVNEHAPIKQRKIKGYRSPFMNGELRRAINVKRMLKRKFDKCNSKINWRKYREQRNIVTKLRKKSVKVYVQSKCDSNSNPKDFWTVVKPMISNRGVTKDDNIILMDNDNKVINEPNEVCQVLNSYFVNVTSDIGPDDSVSTDDDIHSCITKHMQHSSIVHIKQQFGNVSKDLFNFNSINHIDVRQLLKGLKPKKAVGYDMLPSKLLSLSADILCHSICKLLNTSIKMCSFPSAFKYADVCPIYKKGCNLDMSNYRPVSVLPNISKVFEKAYISQLSVYFENIFSPYVSGFRKQHSCETVLCRMTENIKKDLDQGKIVCAVLLDLSKAFDCLPHKLLVSKFNAYGLSIPACELLLSYFTDRKQRVKLGNVKSDWAYVNKGSAQGSIFGPFCYNVFTNDMFLILDDNVDLYNYADDNTLVCSGYNYAEVKNNLLSNVKMLIQWFEDNYMKVNASKFQCIVFGKHDNLGTFNINGIEIVPESNVKLLGLHMDSKLNFSTHIAHVCVKASRQLKVLTRLSTSLDIPNKLLLYNSFMECYFNYCSIIWHFCSSADTIKVERLQKRALQFILRDFSSSYVQLLEAGNKSPIYINRLRKLAEFVFKILHDKLPSYLQNLAQVDESNIYSFRNTCKLVTPRFRTITYGKNSINYTTSTLWNGMNDPLKYAANVNTFKSKLLQEWNYSKCSCGTCVLCRILMM